MFHVIRKIGQYEADLNKNIWIYVIWLSFIPHITNLQKYMASYNPDKELIVKKTIYAGVQAVTFKNGTKVCIPC